MTIYELDAYGVFTQAIDLSTHTGPIGRYVTEAPPATTKRQVARWTGQGWEKVSDYEPPVFPAPSPDFLHGPHAALQRLLAKGLLWQLSAAVEGLEGEAKEQGRLELQRVPAIPPDGVIAGLLQTAPFNTVA